MTPKFYKNLAKFASLAVLYYYLERLYEFIYYPAFGRFGFSLELLKDILGMWTFWALLIGITLMYSVPFLPLIYFGWKKDTPINKKE